MARTGFNIISESAPSAWLVDDPSAPQSGKNDMGISSTFVKEVDRGIDGLVKTFVFALRLAVGCVPSIQIYSARIDMISSVLVWVQQTITGGVSYSQP